MIEGIFWIFIFFSYACIAFIIADKYSKTHEEFFIIFIGFFTFWFMIPLYLIYKFWQFIFDNLIFRKE